MAEVRSRSSPIAAALTVERGVARRPKRSCVSTHPSAAAAPLAAHHPMSARRPPTTTLSSLAATTPTTMAWSQWARPSGATPAVSKVCTRPRRSNASNDVEKWPGSSLRARYPPVSMNMTSCGASSDALQTSMASAVVGSSGSQRPSRPSHTSSPCTAAEPNPRLSTSRGSSASMGNEASRWPNAERWASSAVTSEVSCGRVMAHAAESAARHVTERHRGRRRRAGLARPLEGVGAAAAAASGSKLGGTGSGCSAGGASIGSTPPRRPPSPPRGSDEAAAAPNAEAARSLPPMPPLLLLARGSIGGGGTMGLPVVGGGGMGFELAPGVANGLGGVGYCKSAASVARRKAPGCMAS